MIYTKMQLSTSVQHYSTDRQLCAEGYLVNLISCTWCLLSETKQEYHADLFRIASLAW